MRAGPLLAGCLLPLLPLSCGALALHRRASSLLKVVAAHFIVGNTYRYDESMWARDIQLAQSRGIDAFALNVGNDAWQASRVADAFAAAEKVAPAFRLFLSFDMSSLPCSLPDHAVSLRQYINTYHSHPKQLRYGGLPVVSTFAGEACRFGEQDLNGAWTSVLKSAPQVYFVPAFFVSPSEFSSLQVMSGAFNWNSGWPMGDYDITFNPDRQYISNLDGRPYMAAVSPWFFTHYGRNSYNKNFIYRSDDWLISERWDLLIKNRDDVAMVEIISWNDYGESHYVGPIEGDQPGSQGWTNGFDHTAWLDLMQYYISWYKTGQPPIIPKDKIFMWGRLYPANANAPSDPVGRPNNWQFDFLWAVILLRNPAEVTLTCGDSTLSASLVSGLSKLKLPLVKDCHPNASVARGGHVQMMLAPDGFAFSMTPSLYNFNAFVAESE